jgi:hypothetical protein
MPLAWRAVRVIFILKPGRDSYELAKSFRPISLTSFLHKSGTVNILLAYGITVCIPERQIH